MASFVEERDRSISGGTARWIAVTVKRAWRAQLLAAVGCIAVVWPALAVGGMTPIARTPVVIATGYLALRASAVFRQYDVNLDGMVEASEINTRRKPSGFLSRRPYVYLLCLSGMTVFLGILAAMTVILMVVAGLISPLAVSLVAVGAPLAVIEFEVYLNREHEHSIVALGVNLAEWSLLRLADVTSIERKQRKKDAELAKALLTFPFGSAAGAANFN